MPLAWKGIHPLSINLSTPLAKQQGMVKWGGIAEWFRYQRDTSPGVDGEIDNVIMSGEMTGIEEKPLGGGFSIPQSKIG